MSLVRSLQALNYSKSKLSSKTQRDQQLHTAPTVYLHQYMNPLVIRWLEEDKGAFEDEYALTELIQWVWRSRSGKDSQSPCTSLIEMRQLMEEWLSD